MPSFSVTELTDDVLDVHVKHLSSCMMICKLDFLFLPNDGAWFVDLFVTDSSDDDITQQENFIELQNNTTAQARSKHGRTPEIG